MSTQQTEALQCAADLEYSIPRHRIQDAFILAAYKALKMVRTQHARITELESQLAQRFDAADVATASAQGFRDGVASVSPVSEPVAWKHDCAALLANDVELWIDACPHCGKPRMHATQAAHTSPPEGMAGWRPTSEMRAVVAVAVTMLYDTHPEDVLRVFDLCELEKISIITMLLGSQQVEDIYRSAWDQLTAAPGPDDGGSNG